MKLAILVAIFCCIAASSAVPVEDSFSSVPVEDSFSSEVRKFKSLLNVGAYICPGGKKACPSHDFCCERKTENSGRSMCCLKGGTCCNGQEYDYCCPPGMKCDGVLGSCIA